MLQLILSLIAISGIGTLLALFLEIADSYIADYGESHILINNEKDLVVEGGSPLLSTLMENEIFIPSACGGKGTCSLCKLKILEGGGPVLPTETPYLSKDELEKDVRLSCQVKVRNDLKIEIPEELFQVKEYRVSVENVVDLTDDIRGIQLKILTDEEGISFKPGQYVQLKVPKYEMTQESEYRAYSVASSSEASRHLELLITKVADGAVSTYVHGYMKEGEELTINGPYGDFYLQESEKDILLIATGSGLAPLLSILHQIEKEKIDRKTTLFFGARRVKDLLYYDELKAFEKRLPDLTFMPTLSRSKEEDRWQGEKGRVTDLIEKYIPENADVEVYICGSPVMVESCEEILKKKGISEDNIFYDKFE
jgi:Na+-transporting NADH:ubiquinone oxidoreductase subunit F